MRHLSAEAEIQERAALYALGALSHLEARAFEIHLEDGCEVCARELGPFETVVGALGLAAPEAKPPERARLELLARITKEAPIRSPQFLSVRADEGEWSKVSEGIEMKVLSVGNVGGTATSLVRMGAGTRLPMHRHRGVEQFYVLEGDCNVHGRILGPGDYHRAESGSIHRETFTVKGTLFLLVAPMDYEVLNPQ